MMDLLNFVFQGFWYFLGFLILFSAALNFIYKTITSFLKYLNIRRYGWPPAKHTTIKKEEDI